MSVASGQLSLVSVVRRKESQPGPLRQSSLWLRRLEGCSPVMPRDRVSLRQGCMVASLIVSGKPGPPCAVVIQSPGGSSMPRRQRWLQMRLASETPQSPAPSPVGPISASARIGAACCLLTPGFCLLTPRASRFLPGEIHQNHQLTPPCTHTPKLWPALLSLNEGRERPDVPSEIHRDDLPHLVSQVGHLPRCPTHYQEVSPTFRPAEKRLQTARPPEIHDPHSIPPPDRRPDQSGNLTRFSAQQERADAKG